MPIVTVPNKVLISKARPVKDFGPKLQKLVADMIETLEACVDPVGVGLAAPQVGVGQRIFIAKPTPKSKPQVFINPEIVSIDPDFKAKDPNLVADENAEALEGCLSIPRIWSPVTRPQKVMLSWQDVKGRPHQKEFFGFEAVILQHEIDHLEGVLFTRRASEQKSPLYEERGKKLHEMKI